MADTTHDAANGAAHGAADAAHAATESAGMPQLDFSTYPNQVFWLVVTIVVIYLILSRVALPRIGAVLADRQGTITNDIAAAEELKLKALEAEEAYNQALTDARAEAHKIIAEAKAEMQDVLDAATAEADAQIAVKAAESEKRINEVRAGADESVAEVAKDVAKAIVDALGHTAGPRVINNAVSRLTGGEE